MATTSSKSSSSVWTPAKPNPTPFKPTPSPPQSVGGGSYSGTPYDSGTGRPISYGGGGSSSGGSSTVFNPNAPAPKIQQVFTPKPTTGTYNPVTMTYTSPTGQMSSMTTQQAQSRGAVISFGGGTSPQPSSVKQVEDYAKQVQIQDEINRLTEKQRAEKLSDTYLGTKNTSQQSRISDVITKNRTPQELIKIKERQQKSVQEPTQANLEFLRGTTRYKETGGTKEFLKESAEPFIAKSQISAETANLAFKGIKNREVADYYWARDKEQTQVILRDAQNKINDGANVDDINKQWESYQNKIAGEVNTQAKKDYEKWFTDFKQGEGNNIHQSAMQDLIKFNARYGKPRLNEMVKSTLKEVGIGAGVGALTSAGQATGIFSAIRGGGSLMFGRGVAKAGTKVVTSLIGLPVLAGAVIVGQVKNIYTQKRRESQLQKQYGFSKDEAIRVARLEAENRFVGAGAKLVGFGAGAYAGSTIVSKGLTTLKINSVNKKVDAFKKDLQTDIKLQDKYFTPENIKRGYFTKKFDGANVKITIPKDINVQISARREGINLERDVVSTGASERIRLQPALGEQGIVLDSSQTLSKINIKKFTRLTNQQIGKGEQAYMVSQQVGNEINGVLFKLTSSGKVVGLKQFKFVINPETGVSIIEGVRPYVNPKKINRNGFSVEAQTVREKTRELFAGKVIPRGNVQVGNVRLTNSDIAIAKLKGSKVGTSKGLFDTETTGEMFMRGQSVAINKKGVRITDIGKTQRASLFNKEGGSSFFEKTQTGTARKAVDILPSKNVPKKGTGLFDKPIDDVPLPKPSPKQKSSIFEDSNLRVGEELPSIVGGNQGQSLIYGKPEAGSMFDIKGTLVNRNALIDAEAGIGQNEIIAKALINTPTPGGLRLGRTSVDVKSLGFSNTLFNPTAFSFKKSSPEFKSPTDSIFKNSMLFDKTKLGVSSISSSAVTSSQATGLFQSPAVTPNIEPILFPILQPPITKQPLPQKPFIPQPFTPFFGGLGSPEVGGGQKGKVSNTGLFGGTKYSASLGSILLRQPKVKVTSAQARALAKRTYTGLELRPEIEITNGKKKKKGILSRLFG